MAGITGFNLFFEVLDILGFTGGIGDDIEQFRAKACYDGIVNYTSSSWV